jgi:hypothetical protein
MTPRKPSPRSVTSSPCRCRFLERTAAEPNEAITFEEDVNEYHIVRPQGGHWIVVHCPMCGGAAPRSKSHELFATITEAEADRLEELTGSLRTVNEAIALLGKPDHDMPHGMREHSPATSKAGSRIASYRTLLFTRLSDTADVTLTDYGIHGVRCTFHGKYLGKPTRRKKERAPRRGRPTKR